MKHKLYRKRLSLEKVTIACLNSLQMDAARGGCSTETLELTTCEGPFIYPGRPKPSDNTCFTE
jgi:hypothetical protein